MRTPPTMEYYRIVVLMTDPQFTFQRLPPTLLVYHHTLLGFPLSLSPRVLLLLVNHHALLGFLHTLPSQGIAIHASHPTSVHFRPVITYKALVGSTSRMRVIGEARNANNLLSRTRLIKVHVVFVGGEKRLYGVLICLIEQIGGLSRSPCKME